MNEPTETEKEVIALTAILGQIINKTGPIAISLDDIDKGLPGKELLIDAEDNTWIISLGDYVE